MSGRIRSAASADARPATDPRGSVAKKRTLKVKELATGKVVSEVDVTGKSERMVERVMSGMLRNMDTDRFCVDDSE